MPLLRSLFLFLTFFSANRAFAFDCTYFPDHTEVLIRDIDEPNLSYACHGPKWRAELQTIYSLSSYGGKIDRINDIVTGLRKAIVEAREASGITPVFVVHNYCMSACIPILAGVNQMAEENLVELVVANDLVLGFHGCSDSPNNHRDQKTYSVDGTNRYLGYFEGLGASGNWLAKNRELFASDNITEFLPTDPRLNGAGFLTAAHLVDIDTWSVDYQQKLQLMASAGR